MSPKIAGTEYPNEVLEAFTENMPSSAQRLGDYLNGKTNDATSKFMLDAFYEGWKAGRQLFLDEGWKE
jgi:hypothetical protein